MNFASDNASGVHPAIMAALAAANDGQVASYGRDPLTAAAEDRVREVFDAPDAQVFLLGTGTGANALALAQLCPPWGRIFCHEIRACGNQRIRRPRLHGRRRADGADRRR